MPFFEGLESGVMRPVFLPDGSLLLGQTGRGWQAKGGKVASLQHVRWDGKTVAPQIVAMSATPRGIPHRSHAAARQWRERGDPASALSLESWTYRDAPDYGSPELDLHGEEHHRDRDRRGSQVHRHHAGVDRAEDRCIRGRPRACITRSSRRRRCSMRTRRRSSTRITRCTSFRRRTRVPQRWIARQRNSWWRPSIDALTI